MLLILFFLTVISAFAVNFWRNLSNYPKGPTPLLLIGNLHQLAFRIWKNGGFVAGFDSFRKEYGKVFTLWLGPVATVYIGDYDVAHETHVKRANVFGTRLKTGRMDYLREGRGLLMSNGEFWQDHRRFALQTLRNFGLGRNIMEERIMEEFNYRMNDFRKTNFKNGGIEVHSGSFCDLLVGSIINTLLTSERFEQDDEEFKHLKDSFAKAMEEFSIFDVISPLWLINSKWMKWRTSRVSAPFDFIHATCQKNVQKRIESIERGEHVIEGNGNDFIDAFLAKMEKDKKDGVETTFNLETLVFDLYDLWIGGQETTSTTLMWACACLLNHPQVARKLRNELLSVTGGNRNVSLTDRTQTPYLNAVIHEVQRFASILNIGFFRDIFEDTHVDGKMIAAGTKVMAQMMMIHRDEELFENPAEFNPERFLGNTLDKTLIPFGIGKRTCPGESLARAELFLLIGNLVLNYDLEPVGDVPELKTCAPFSILNREPDYNIRFVPLKH